MGSGADDFLARMRVARRDLGRLLFHLTRTPGPQTPPLRTRSYAPSAHDALRNILIEGRLAGTSGFIRGGYKCICFSESPITELVSLFKLSELAAQQSQRPKYEPYGVAVTKDWLFARGGRPVIYQPDSEYEQLPESLRYRHVRYEPPGIDFTWEREWRLCANELRLEPESTLSRTYKQRCIRHHVYAC